jgi:hypothetical protein
MVPMLRLMHVHPRTSPETLLPSTPLPAASRKGGSSAQPTVTGLYAQTLQNSRKSATTGEDDSGAGFFSSLTAEGESSVATGGQDGSSADVSVAPDASIPLTYTAAGALSGPPPVAGEIFEATV